MQFVDGAHHITFLTEDMDRLLSFYVRVFDAEVTLDMTEEGLRHAFLKVGPTTVLHPFEMLEARAAATVADVQPRSPRPLRPPGALRGGVP